MIGPVFGGPSCADLPGRIRVAGPVALPMCVTGGRPPPWGIAACGTLPRAWKSCPRPVPAEVAALGDASDCAVPWYHCRSPCMNPGPVKVDDGPTKLTPAGTACPRLAR